MDFQSYLDPAEFLAVVEPFLLQAEAENNLIIGIATRLAQDGMSAYGSMQEKPLLASVTEGGQVSAVAIQTPPYNLVLSRATDDALELIARNVLSLGRRIPGFHSPKESAEAFSSIWKRLTGQEAVLHKALRIYQLDRVIPAPPVEGEMKPAGLDDLEIVENWNARFAQDCDTIPSHNIKARIEKQEIYLWKTPEPVAIAATTGPTSNGIRIGMVYTPPEQRRKGYATALTAELSQKMLDSGRRFCFLFTDLANPTSNSIYQKIGYRPVCDVNDYSLFSSQT